MSRGRILRLTRIGYLPWGTFGRLVLPGGRELVTVEAPWLDNRAGESCIPEGRYPLARDTWNAPSVPLPTLVIPDEWSRRHLGGRDELKVHPANRADQVRGCIAVGRRFGIVNGGHGVLDSRAAHADMMRDLEGLEDLILVVRSAPPAGVRGTPSQRVSVEGTGRMSPRDLLP